MRVKLADIINRLTMWLQAHHLVPMKVANRIYIMCMEETYVRQEERIAKEKERYKKGKRK